MSKALKIKEELKLAMKSKDKVRLDSLRMLLSSLENLKVTLKVSDVSELTDSQVDDVVIKQLKLLSQEKESLIFACRSTEKVDSQILVITEFSPVYLSEDEIKTYLVDKISELGITDIKQKGKLMGVISKDLKGKADMSVVNKLISTIL